MIARESITPGLSLTGLDPTGIGSVIAVVPIAEGALCEGKQVLNDVARTTGFAGAPALVQATFAAWARDGAQIPEELIAFRGYLARL